LTFYVLTLYLLDMKTTNPTIQSVWEENDSTEQSKKFENKQIFVQNNGINATNNLFVKKECKDIGSKKKCRCDINHIGEQFGKLTIIKQYSVRNKRHSELKVDYKCDCGTTTFENSYQKV